MPRKLKIKSHLLILSFLLLILPSLAYASTSEVHNKKYLITLKKNSNINEFVKNKGSNLKKIKKTSFNTLIIEAEEQDLSALKTDMEVVSVEQDSPVKIASIDQKKPRELNNTTQLIPWGIQDIGASTAVNNKVDGKKVKIALLDTGVYNHSDLKIAGGVSFVDGISDYFDDNGHGTHVAGTIAALNNGYGVVGVAPKAEIYAVKVLDKNGDGSYSQVIEGINWAIENKIDIISMSFGGFDDKLALREAVKAAHNAGILVVAAAGNSGPGSQTILYPANYPEVVSVGAVDKEHHRASFSSTGPNLDLVAPGVEILSITSDGGYSEMSGTSMATPHVTGAAASLWSENPSLTNKQIEQKLYSTATPLGPASYYGHGLVDLDRALGIDSIPVPTVPPENNNVFDINEKDRRLLVLSKKLYALIDKAKAKPDIKLAKKIEQDYYDLMIKSRELHQVPESITSIPKDQPQMLATSYNDYFFTKATSFENLENDYANLVNFYSGQLGILAQQSEISIKAFDQTGDGQTVTPGQSVTVSLKLFEPKNTVYVDVLDINDNVIEHHEFYDQPSYTTIPFTWYTSASNAEGEYRIRYSYSDTPSQYNDYFTIYVRYDTLWEYYSANVDLPVGQTKIYKFVPSTSGEYDIFTSPYNGTGAGNDTYLILADDPDIEHYELKRDDDSNGNGFSKITYYLYANTTYYIYIRPYNMSSGYVHADLTARPYFPIERIESGIPKDVDISAGNFKAYQFIAPSTESFKIATDFYSGDASEGYSDTRLWLYTDSNLTNVVGYNDDIQAGNQFSSINYPMERYYSYYIKLDGWNGGSVHARLSVDPLIQEPPSIPIYNNTPIDVNLPIGESQLYKFTAPSSGSYRIRTGYYADDCSSGENDTIIYLYDDQYASHLVEVNEDSNGTKFSEIYYTMTGGASYFIKLAGFNGGPVHARISVTQQERQEMTISGVGSVSKSHTINPEDKDEQTSQLEPVDISTGAQYIENTLLKVNGAMPLSFDVRYDSLLLNIGPLGRGWVHNYETSLKQLPSGDVVVNWNANRGNSFIYVGNDHYISYDTATKYDKLVKNGDGSYSLTKKDQTTYWFNSGGQLGEIQDGHGKFIWLQYDASGRLFKIADPFTECYISIFYKPSGLIDYILDNANRRVSFEHDADLNLTKITDARGNSTSYTYESHGWMETLTDKENIRIFTNHYDDKGRVTVQEDPLNNVSTLSYDETSEPGKLITTMTDRLGATKVFTFDSNYHLLSVQDELGNLTSYKYDSDGNKEGETDPYGNITKYGYDDYGNLQTVQDPSGKMTWMTYDDRNNLETVTNNVYKSFRYTYDQNNNVLTVTDQLGNVSTNEYNGSGFLMKTIKPRLGEIGYVYHYGRARWITVNGSVKSDTEYDSVGRVVRKTDGLGKTTSMTYDNNDNLLTVTDPLGHTTSYTYDNNNQRVTETDAKGNTTVFSYCYSGNLETVTDALSHTVRYDYDKEDRLFQTTDPKGNVITLGYDAKGRLTSTTDALGNTKTIEYDNMDRVTGKKDAYGRLILSNAYDILGNLLSVTDAVYSTVYNHYDDLNRVDIITDPLGHVTNLQYDDLNRLIMVSDPLNGVSSQIFDRDGNMNGLVDPNGNQTIFDYDTAGRLTSKTFVYGEQIILSYNGADQLQRMINGRGQITDYQYYDDGRLRSFTDREGTVTYEYDNNGNITTVNDSNGAITREYDSLNRLKKYTDVVASRAICQWNSSRQWQLEVGISRNA